MENQKYMAVFVQAYDDLLPDGQITNSVLFELLETDPDKAVKRAKKLIKKKNYRVSRIIENFKPHATKR